MIKFSEKLKISASVIALMCGAGITASSAAATLTISDTQSGVTVPGDITGDLIVTSTGKITPDGLVANGVSGNVSNSGTIELIDSSTLTAPGSVLLDITAADISGIVGASVFNAGTINAKNTTTATDTLAADVEGAATITATNSLSTVARGLTAADVEAGLTNSSSITAQASNTLSATATAISDTAGADITMNETKNLAEAQAVGIDVLKGIFTNASGGTISSDAKNAATYALSAAGAAADVHLAVDSNWAIASGVSIGDGTYTMVNSGTISASASNAIAVDAGAEATDGTGEVADLTRVRALAFGLNLDGAVKGLTNSGTVTATASSKSGNVLDVAATGNAEAVIRVGAGATAEGILVSDLDGAFSNTGTISATASADSSLKAVVDSSAGDAAIFDPGGFSNYTYTDAIGVAIRQQNGAFSNGGQITASATTKAVYDLAALGADDAAVALTPVYNTPTATGLYVSKGAISSFTNSGTISASALGSLDLVTKAVAADGSASVDVSPDAWAYAYGAALHGTVNTFSNSGTISAVAGQALTNTLTAAGETNGYATVSNSVYVSGYGLRIDELNTSFANSGTISADMTANLSFAADVSAASGGAQLDADYDGDWIEIYGVLIEDASGYLDSKEDLQPASVTNASGGVISVKGVGSAALDLKASGTAATVTVGELEQNITGAGLQINEGYYSLSNSGTISADLSGTAVIKASAVGSEEDGGVFLPDVSQIVEVYGVRAGGEVTAVSNGGTISATAAASLTETLSAKGGTSASVSVSNEVVVGAYGLHIDNPLAADLSNTGTISASATGSFSLTVTSNVGSDAGNVRVSNDIEVLAIGVSADFATPEAENDTNVFTNTGKITAAAALSSNIVLPASTDPAPTVDSWSAVTAVGADLRGDLASVVNSGTISAAVDAANVNQAGAFGLSLLDASAGLTVTNSGTISADIKGTANDALAIALLIGPLDPPLEPTGNQTGGQITSVNTITITNSGTISATNSAGPSFGIGALFAPDPLVINQQGGKISAETAIAIDQGNADTVNWTGGEIHGIVAADELDVVNVFSGTGTPASKTITATSDFTLQGGAALNIGQDDKAVTFSFAGTVDGTGEVNLNKNASLVVQPSGTMSVGTFTMAPSTQLTFVFNPTDAGEILTGGDANIDGVLNAVALPGLYGNSGSHVVIATEGEVVGSFDNASINGDTLLLDFTAAVHDQDVTISWKRNAFNAVPGLTINSTSVATALEDGYDTKRAASKNTPELNDILSAMFTLKDGARYDRVLNSWSGSEHAQVMRAAANLSEPYHMAVSEHLNDIRHSGGADGQVVMLRPQGSSNSIAPLSAAGASTEDPKFAFWGRAYGRWASTRGDVEATGYNEDTYGVVIGADFRVSPNVVIGVVTGYGDDKLDFDDGDLGKIKRWTIGGYLSATIDRFYIDGSLTYASDSYRVHRTIEYGTTTCLAFNCTTGASSKYDGDGILGHAEVGYMFDLGNGTSLRPFAGLNYSSVDADPFTETGGGDLGLSVADGTGKSLQSRLGARLSGEWGSGSTKWIPELRVEWRHEFKDDPAWIAASLNGLPSETFVAIGSKVTQDLGVVGAGVTALISNGVGVFFDYQGAFGSGYHSHAVQGGVRVKF
jgi:outer membrane autotransporter protein